MAFDRTAPPEQSQQSPHRIAAVVFSFRDKASGVGSITRSHACGLHAPLLLPRTGTWFTQAWHTLLHSSRPRPEVPAKGHTHVAFTPFAGALGVAHVPLRLGPQAVLLRRKFQVGPRREGVVGILLDGLPLPGDRGGRLPLDQF